MDSKSTFAIIGNQMNIPRFTGESSKLYNSRVAYSALSMWIRLLSATTGDSSDNLSKSSLHRKVGSILSGYIAADPDIEEWFYPSAESDPINIIRNALLRAGDIIEIGFPSRICSCPLRKDYFSEIAAFAKGGTTVSQIDYASGLAGIVHGHSKSPRLPATILYEDFGIPNYQAQKRIDELLNNARWEKTDKIDSFEFFDPNKNSVLSGCWTRFLPLNSHQLYIARRQFSFGVFEYQLAKCEENDVYLSPCTHYQQNELTRETQRLLYAIKGLYGRKVTARVEKGATYSQWHFWSKLPPAEEMFLRYISWPLNDINNPKNEFVVRNEFNSLLYELANNLNIIVEEHKYG